MTVTGNRAQVDGGGIKVRAEGTADVANSIIAGNIDGSPEADHPDCSGTILSSQGHNLIQNTAGCFIGGVTTGNLTGVDPNLGPLQDNGGPTLTHALLTESPASDAGNPSGCTDHQGNPLLMDQRGKPRVRRCDIGAYELFFLDFSRKNTSNSAVLPGAPVTYTIAFNNPGTLDTDDVQVADILPVFLTYLDDSLSASHGTYGYANGVITWTGSLSATERATITFRATVNSTTPLGTSIVNSAVISSSGETITRTATVYVGYSVYLPLVSRARSVVLFADDFSTDKGWINATLDHFFRDAENEWLSWHIDRSSLEQYYIPIEPFSGDFRLEVRVKAAYSPECNLYIGLVENMESVWPTTATGAFFGIGGWEATGSNNFINPWINFTDGASTVGWDPADPSTWIASSPDTWYRVVFKIEDDTWEIAAYTESGKEVGGIHGVMPSNHSGYHYIMLANPDGDDWHTGDGLLDDLELERLGE